MTIRILRAALVAAIITLTTTALHAQVPNVINYQGRIAVGTASPVNFNGAGSFKFALVNAAGTTTFWSNNNSSTAGSEPTAAVSLTVTKGLYSVLLGDTSLAGITLAIPASAWSNADVRLRVWFNDGVNGSQLLTPDQRLAPNGYLPDAGVSNAKLANATVTVSPGAGLTGGGVVALGGAITLSANTGTGPNQLVALNGSAQLPALSGVNLTNLSGGNLTAGSVPLAALGANSVDSAKIVDGSIVNADVNSAAGIVYAKLNLAGSIVNNDLSAAAAIADTKLGTISSAGKVANSATTGASTNTASTLVLRDAGGNFSAGTITASLAGNASSATTATTAGNVTGIVGLANGGTGANAAAAARTNLGAASLAANVFTGIQNFSDIDLQLHGANALTGLGWYGVGKPFGGSLTPDGPVLYGNNTGVLATKATGNRTVLFWNSAGQVGINGIILPSYTLEVNGSVGGVGAYVNTSDARFKKDVQPIGGALEKITRMRGVNFDWRRDEFPDKQFGAGRQIGFIAQELREVLPEAVSEDRQGFLSVAYSEVTPVIVEAIKEQQRRITAKDAEIEALKNEVARQNARLDALEAALIQTRTSTSTTTTTP